MNCHQQISGPVSQEPEWLKGCNVWLVSLFFKYNTKDKSSALVRVTLVKVQQVQEESAHRNQSECPFKSLLSVYMFDNYHIHIFF